MCRPDLDTVVAIRRRPPRPPLMTSMDGSAAIGRSIDRPGRRRADFVASREPGIHVHIDNLCLCLCQAPRLAPQSAVDVSAWPA